VISIGFVLKVTTESIYKSALSKKYFQKKKRKKRKQEISSDWISRAISPEGWAREAQSIMRTGYRGAAILAGLLVRFE